MLRKWFINLKKIKKLDVVICNAGESKSCSPGKENFMDWEKMFKQNFFSASNIIENTKKHLIKSSGKIICISSICGNEIIKGAPITYSTAKAALNFYVKSLSHYLPKNVSINIISPGNILFKNSLWERKMKLNKNMVKNVKRKVPLKKLGSLNVVSLTCFDFRKFKFYFRINFIVDGGQTLKYEA